jgi:hypothetical protein
MSKITEVLLNWQVLLIALVVSAVLGVLRAIGTKKDSTGKVIGGWAQNRYFQMFLPLYPYVLSVGFVFLPGVSLPDLVVKTLAVKVLFGVYAGWLSGFSFQVVKSILEKGFNMKFGADKE